MMQLREVVKLWPFVGLDVVPRPTVPETVNWRYIMEFVYSHPTLKYNFEWSIIEQFQKWKRGAVDRG